MIFPDYCHTCSEHLKLNDFLFFLNTIATPLMQAYAPYDKPYGRMNEPCAAETGTHMDSVVDACCPR
jgi:hypothetical protein